jgi:hypothetical protein
MFALADDVPQIEIGLVAVEHLKQQKEVPQIEHLL